MCGDKCSQGGGVRPPVGYTQTYTEDTRVTHNHRQAANDRRTKTKLHSHLDEFEVYFAVSLKTGMFHHFGSVELIITHVSSTKHVLILLQI